MPVITHLSDIWEHPITKILKHDTKSKVGFMVREWVISHKYEDFNSLLNWTVDDLTLSSNLCYSKDNVEILHQTPLQECLTSDGIFNISLMEVDLNMMIMTLIIL